MHAIWTKSLFIKKGGGMQAIWKFLTPRQIIFGNGASKDISLFINETDSKKYLIVSGKVVRAAGLLNSLEKTLSDNNILL